MAERSLWKTSGLSRRELLFRAARLGVAWPLGVSTDASFFLLDANFPAQLASDSKLSPSDDAFLDELETACFRFFWEQADPNSGLVKDRSRANGHDSNAAGSIAATGFGLTALAVADHRGWERPEKIRGRVRATLRFLQDHVTHEHGFYFHFLDLRTGSRLWNCELSSIDTAILLCGVLTCRTYFEDREIHELADALYQRVDWTWMLNDGETLSHGWKPETGFLKFRWDSYSELMMMVLLGLGSSSHPLPPEAWDAWKRPQFEYEGIRFIGGMAPLFMHQYSHAWFDFRNQRDSYADYFANSILATRAHRAWCLELARQFPDYSEDLWGISASDSSQGYVAWGGPPPMGPVDGTVVPAAAAGSLPFLPQEALRVLRTIRGRFRTDAWKHYGFVDAFNPLTKWCSSYVIGIDVGITVLMAENVRSGFVWEQFMKNKEAQRGMARAKFKLEDEKSNPAREVSAFPLYAGG